MRVCYSLQRLQPIGFAQGWSHLKWRLADWACAVECSLSSWDPLLHWMCWHFPSFARQTIRKATSRRVLCVCVCVCVCRFKYSQRHPVIELWTGGRIESVLLLHCFLPHTEVTHTHVHTHMHRHTHTIWIMYEGICMLRCYGLCCVRMIQWSHCDHVHQYSYPQGYTLLGHWDTHC